MKFPKIYRSFTDPLRQSFSEARRFTKFRKKNLKLLKQLKLQSVVSLYILTVALILLLSIDILGSLQKQKEENFERAKIEGQIKLWEGIAEQYKGYKEAYFQLALLEYEIKDFPKAKDYVNKALYLDPNFEKARDLQNTLRNY